MKKTLFIGIPLILIGWLLYAAYMAADRSAAPTWAEHDQRMKLVKTSMESLLQKIQLAHGEGRCDDSSQCKVAGMGQMSCGGYNAFMIFSTRDASESEILALIRQYNVAAEEFNKLSLVVAPCGKQPERIVCQRRECVPAGNN